jgi:hypothetical protein
MKIGVFSTFMSPNATPQMIRDFGRRTESMGLDSIWMGEHVVLFDKQTFGYPGSKDGRIPGRRSPVTRFPAAPHCPGPSGTCS